jgi:hypothetical protein
VQVCEWCLQLELDASPFFDYGITGAVLVGLSDGDFQARARCGIALERDCPRRPKLTEARAVCVCAGCTRPQNLLGLSTAQIARVRHALGSNSDAGRRGVPAESPVLRSGAFPSLGVPTLPRKLADGGGRSPTSVAAADSIASAAPPPHWLLSGTRPPDARADPKPSPDAAPTASSAPRVPKAAPLFADDSDSPPAFGGAVKSKPVAAAAPAPKRAPLFADDPDSPTAPARAPNSSNETASAVAAPTAREAKPAALFADSDGGSSPTAFNAAAKSKPAAPVAAAAAAKPSKSLFADSDEDEDGGALFTSRAPAPHAAPAPHVLRKPTSLFDDSESDEDAAGAKASRAPAPTTHTPVKEPARLDVAEEDSSSSPRANANGALQGPLRLACSVKAPSLLIHFVCACFAARQMTQRMQLQAVRLARLQCRSRLRWRQGHPTVT